MATGNRGLLWVSSNRVDQTILRANRLAADGR
jgi:hypothetical protein